MSRLISLFFIIAMLGAFVLLGMPNNIHAQTVPRFTAQEISLNVDPPNPEAFESVTISLETYAIDIDLYNIIWIVDGEERLSGLGEKSLTVSVGQYGESTNVAILIEAKDGRIVRKSISLRPATVDVLWEAIDSYVPPFYQGKALPSRGAIIKITAIPNLVFGEDNYISADQLDYTWSWNYRVKDTSSGFNKQFMAIKNLFTNRQEVLSVEVQNVGGLIRGEGETSISFVTPEIIFYNVFTTNQPDLRRAYGNNFTTSDSPIVLGAVPYFFSLRPDTTLDSLAYEWEINKKIVTTNNTVRKNQISVLLPERGAYDIGVSVENPVEDFQFTDNSINIISN
ncbi:MAG: hypothetical protein KBC22_00575 [Candidatus Pacebacteria bacterium]|nr:hypothetical protein [Candidatus Paceibacterota bacterium]